MNSRIFRKSWSLCLAAAMVITLFACGLPARALAASFSDVPSDDYYSQAVEEMSSAGLVSGYDDGTFRPMNSVTNAEALALVCTSAGIACQGYSQVSGVWYADVLTWCEVHGIAPYGTAADSAATREQICTYIAAAYKFDASSAPNAFPDTTSPAANVLYQKGVISGMPSADGGTVFGGGLNVKRCDVCIMLMQLREKAAKPDWSKQTAYALDLSHYEFSAPSTVSTFGELVQAIGYAYIHAPCTIEIALCPDSDITDLQATMNNAYEYARLDYYEFYANGYSDSYWYWGTAVSRGSCAYVTIETTGYDRSTGGDMPAAETRRRSEVFYHACWEDVAGLYESGSLTSAMTDRQKADVLCHYVHEKLSYDYNFKNFSGYDAVTDGTVVCEGYTAFYNCLCNIAGVHMEAETDSQVLDHAWSWTYSGGTVCNVDVTFCDADSDYNYMHSLYFWVTDEQIKAADVSTAGTARVSDSAGVYYGFV